MTDQVVIALIAVSGVVLGGLLTGGFALMNQWMARTTAELQTQREAGERNRTLFHEDRRDAYADFLAAVNDASGVLSNGAIERQLAAGHAAEAPGTVRRDFPPSGQFGQDAPTRMSRQQTVVSMISGSPEVRQASEDLRNAVIGYLLVEPNPDHRKWNQDMFAAQERQRDAYDHFVDAANAELTARTSAQD